MTDNKQLSVIAQESGLEPSKTEVLLSKFGMYFEDAKHIANESKSITVNNEEDFEGMALAKEKRLELKRIRVSAEKTRKELKEQSLREGRAIDGIANVIKALIVPVEEHLEKQEKFAEVQEQIRLDKKENERISKLSKYVEDVSMFKLREMSDEAFDNLLKGQKQAFELQQEAERKAEEERLEKEKKERDYQTRKMFLLPLHGNFVEELTLETTEKEFEALKEKAVKHHKEYLAEQERIKKENEQLQKQKAEEERKRKEAEEKLRKEKEAQAEKERLAKEEEARKKAEEEEARKKALLAPDKEKLERVIEEINEVQLPHLETLEAGEILDTANDYLVLAVKTLKEGIKKL